MMKLLAVVDGDSPKQERSNSVKTRQYVRFDPEFQAVQCLDGPPVFIPLKSLRIDGFLVLGSLLQVALIGRQSQFVAASESLFLPEISEETIDISNSLQTLLFFLFLSSPSIVLRLVVFV